MLPRAWVSTISPMTAALAVASIALGQEGLETNVPVVPACGVVLWERPGDAIGVLDLKDSLCIVGDANSAYPPSCCGMAGPIQEPILPGRAAVYSWDGVSWLHRGSLVPIGSRDVRGFGHAVAIDGRTAVVSMNS